MTNKLKAIAKGGIATAAVGAMALTAATPAAAEHRDRDGISVGDVIAGAVIIGGIAAVASAANRDRGGYDYRDGRYYGRDGYNGYDRYGYRGNPRSAVERCVQEVRRDARRYGYRSAQVTDIRDVRDTRYGWRITGRVVVDSRYGGERYDRYGYGRDYDRYDRGDHYDRGDRYDRYDRYDRGDRYDRYGRDAGTFTCNVQRGRVDYVDFDGIRGLR